MLRNYIKTAFRNLRRHKSYTLINIMGLAIGMACVLLIMLFVQSELQYDRHHANMDRIYRLNIQVTNPQTGHQRQRAIGPYRLGKEMVVDFEDLEIVRFAPQGREEIVLNDISFNEENLAFVDENVFDVFGFKVVSGDPSTALVDPFSLVMSESAARKYFNDANPVGRTVTIRDNEYAVTAIMENVPEHTQLDFDVLVSMNSGEEVFGRIVLENWGEGYVETFAMVPAGRKAADFAERVQAFVDIKLADWSNFSPEIVMQPFSEMYLRSKDISSFFTGGDVTYVYAFSFIALFILIIACINYMNLSTARSSLRAREVGLRKVVGASRRQLMGQFLSESTILATVSLAIGLALAALFLPMFNQLAAKDMTTASLFNSQLLLGLLGVTLFVGLVAGSYPAIVLSSFKPIGTLSGSLSLGVRGGNLRKVLVTFQFATSIFLLVVTAVVQKQLSYCKNADLGYDREHLVLISGTSLDLRGKYAQFRTELMKNPKVLNAAGSSRVPPGNLSSSLTARPEGVPEDEQRGMQTVWTDYDFIETIGLEVIAGRSFSRDFPADATEGFVLNEAAVKSIGWTPDEAINKTFGSSEISNWESGQWENRDGRVIGVLKDFHFESLKDKIVPTVYFVAPYMAWNFVVRIEPGNIPQTIKHIEKVWADFNSEIPFEYTFVDENFASLYETEERQGRIFAIFAGLAILIACLGLIGLASFTAERKKKEVGIRKVLGASSANLIYLLSREFTWLVLIAFLFAAPISYYVMQGWLQDFVYQTRVGIMLFIGAGGAAILIAWLTVGLQTARTALSNPVDAIQYE